MKIVCTLLILTLAATPALARNKSHVPMRGSVACVPSADPGAPACGVKDEAPTYFGTTAPVEAKPTPATTATPAAAPKARKHKKINPEPKPEEAPPEEGWERNPNAQTY